MSADALYASPRIGPRGTRELTLLDLLDRLLAGGVVIHGQVMLAAAEIDLVRLNVALLVSSVDKVMGE